MMNWLRRSKKRSEKDQRLSEQLDKLDLESIILEKIPKRIVELEAKADQRLLKCETRLDMLIEVFLKYDKRGNSKLSQYGKLKAGDVIPKIKECT